MQLYLSNLSRSKLYEPYTLYAQDNMRFVSWPVVSEGYYVLHPDPITNANVRLAMDSGALFARKFDLKVVFVVRAILHATFVHSDEW